MPSYPAAVLAQSLTCEQKTIWEVLHTMYVKGRGDSKSLVLCLAPRSHSFHTLVQVWNAFYVHFPVCSQGQPYLHTIAYCLCWYMYHKLPLIVMLFWVIAVKYPSLGCVCPNEGCWDGEDDQQGSWAVLSAMMCSCLFGLSQFHLIMYVSGSKLF